MKSLAVLARFSLAFLVAVAVPAPVFAQEKVPLRTLWRVLVGGADYMTTISSVERSAFPSDGSIFYVPADQVTGTGPLFRLYNNSTDHMESMVAGEGGYTTEGIIGYPWTGSGYSNGLVQINRASNGADHATVKAGESLPGYSTVQGFARWGYPRYHNSNEALNGLSAGGVSVASNSVAGGAIWSWQWNGMEFVDTADYGREIQTAVIWWDENQIQYNPTEAGDEYSTSSISIPDRHGSPVLNNHNSGLTQITRAIPLDFDPSYHGGGQDRPIIYKDMIIGKNLTLNYNNMGPVAEYVTHVVSPVAISNAQVEIPTGYLKANFSRYFTYDAQTQVQTEVFPPACQVPNQNVGFIPGSGYGGVIISDAAQQYAMGVYGRTPAANGPVHYFTLWNFVNCGGTSKWSAVNGPGTLPSGETTFKTWVVTGTLSDVSAKMRQLFLDGAS